MKKGNNNKNDIREKKKLKKEIIVVTFFLAGLYGCSKGTVTTENTVHESNEKQSAIASEQKKYTNKQFLILFEEEVKKDFQDIYPTEIKSVFSDYFNERGPMSEIEKVSVSTREHVAQYDASIEFFKTKHQQHLTTEQNGFIEDLSDYRTSLGLYLKEAENDDYQIEGKKEKYDQVIKNLGDNFEAASEAYAALNKK